VSPEVLDAVSGRTGRRSGQSPLFDDLRRARPGAQACPAASEPGDSGSAAPRGERDPRSGDDRLTLEASLERIWEGLFVVGAAECPVCGGVMRRVEERGVCVGCGSALS
jgi:hypothetical protein